MKILYILICIIVLIIFISLFFYKTTVALNNFGKPVYKLKQIKENLFIKEKNWGITSDHRVIVVSTSPKIEFALDSTKDYIINTHEIYYKIENEIIYIYSLGKASIPKFFNSKYKIKYFELSEVQMMTLIANRKYNTGIIYFD